MTTQLTPVVWKDLINAGLGSSSNSLIKTLIDNQDVFNAGAISTKTITSFADNAGISFILTPGSNGTGTACGLSSKNLGQDPSTTTDFVVVSNAGLIIYELGLIQYILDLTVNASNVISMIFLGGVINYQVDGVTIYTSTVALSNPLFVKASLRKKSPAEVTNVNIIENVIPPIGGIGAGQGGGGGNFRTSTGKAALKQRTDASNLVLIASIVDSLNNSLPKREE